MPELLDSIPPEALECTFLKPGRGEGYKHGWVHVKTCPFTIVALPVAGRYEVALGGEHAVCEPGEAFLVNANREVAITHHAAGGAGGVMSSRWLHAHWTLFGAVDFAGLLDLPLRLDATRTRPLWDLIEELLALTDSGLSAAARRQELSFRALRLLCAAAPARPGALEALGAGERLRPVTAFIRSHLADRLAVEDLAGAVYLSGSRLHALFRETLGRSPMAYVRELRLAEARRLLSATELAVSEIAEKTGFANQFHFSRAFRKAAGMTPSAYRRAHSALLV
jgi:AraC-like DNA-binding protein